MRKSGLRSPDFGFKICGLWLGFQSSGFGDRSEDFGAVDLCQVQAFKPTLREL